MLDEPEAALSPQRQLAFLAALHAHVTVKRSQFLIATHSPILLAYPDARIYEFGPERIAETTYPETEQFRITRDFLLDPGRFLRHLFEPLVDPHGQEPSDRKP